MEEKSALETPSKRKIVLINPRFQLKFILQLVFFELLIILVFYSANLHFFKEYLLAGKRVGLPENHVFFKFLMDQYHVLNWIFAITTCIALICIIVFGLYFSHRIAGPFYRFCQHLKKASQSKETQELVFRPDDYFQEVAVSFNAYLKATQDHKQEK